MAVQTELRHGLPNTSIQDSTLLIGMNTAQVDLDR